MIVAERYHDISAGHRVYRHESKCAHMHGHNYRVHFTCESPELDSVGRVIDFSVMKERLCMWLENNWDHKFLVWQEDPWSVELAKLDPTIVVTPFNPTAENMARFLLMIIGPQVLWDTDVVLIKVKVEETRKCSASFWEDPEKCRAIQNEYKEYQAAQQKDAGPDEQRGF